MNDVQIKVYQQRHPAATLITESFPHCAAALNAMFGHDVWVRDEDLPAAVVDETLDISTPEGVERLRTIVKEDRFSIPPTRRASDNTEGVVSRLVAWRAPTETLSGPCTLWRETRTVRHDVDEVNAIRAFTGQPLLTEAEVGGLTKDYTVYILVCVIDNLLDGDFQTLTRIADRHHCALGAEAVDSKLLVQIAFTR